jgi:glucokinase
MTEPGKYWVGFDLGGTKMMAMAFDPQFQCLARERRKTKGHEGARTGLQRIEQMIEETLVAAKIPRAKLGGIGIGCPGAIDLERGIILESANLGWRDTKVRERISRTFGCPVALMNDVDAGLYGEYRFGAARDARCVLGVFPGTGIGGGCIYEGKVFRGRKYSCMEIGHIQVRSDGRLCGCGRSGCLETEASRLAVAAEAARAAYRGEAPNLMAIAGTDLSKIRSGALADAIRAGDVVIEQIISRAARFIGTAIGSLMNLLAPDVVVLGGGLIEALPKLMVDTIEQAARAQAMPTFCKSVKFVEARLGDDANAMGAAAWVETTLTTASAPTKRES